MSGSIRVELTDEECDILAMLSNELGLAQSCVLVEALRYFNQHREPVAPDNENHVALRPADKR